MKEKLVPVARFSSYIEADLARQRLEDQGVKAVVTGQNVGNTYSGVPAAIDIELQTLESQAGEAREILESFEPQQGQEDWDSDDDLDSDEHDEQE